MEYDVNVTVEMTIERIVDTQKKELCLDHEDEDLNYTDIDIEVSGVGSGTVFLVQSLITKYEATDPKYAGYKLTLTEFEREKAYELIHQAILDQQEAIKESYTDLEFKGDNFID